MRKTVSFIVMLLMVTLYSQNLDNIINFFSFISNINLRAGFVTILFIVLTVFITNLIDPYKKTTYDYNNKCNR